MKRNKSSKNINKNSRLLLKVGITYVIPIFLIISGIFLVLLYSWNKVGSEMILFGGTNSNNQGAGLQRVEFDINNQKVYKPYMYEKFAEISIQNINVDSNVYEGETSETLVNGFGHNVGSVIPGEKSNCVLSGERIQKLENFDKIKVGDQVVMKMSYGTYFYSVSSIQMLDKDDPYIKQKTKVERLTISMPDSSKKIGETAKRLVVTCDFVEVK